MLSEPWLPKCSFDFATCGKFFSNSESSTDYLTRTVRTNCLIGAATARAKASFGHGSREDSAN